ncbi:hypothetical protein F5884DRAFT_829625 [Xylogone sp. PMI_703]|nr:hypothetical protein F5884DRAFT_829625 [Xylogone sp. PMI_703]
MHLPYSRSTMGKQQISRLGFSKRPPFPRRLPLKPLGQSSTNYGVASNQHQPHSTLTQDLCIWDLFKNVQYNHQCHFGISGYDGYGFTNPAAHKLNFNDRCTINVPHQGALSIVLDEDYIWCQCISALPNDPTVRQYSCAQRHVTIMWASDLFSSPTEEKGRFQHPTSSYTLNGSWKSLISQESLARSQLRRFYGLERPEQLPSHLSFQKWGQMDPEGEALTQISNPGSHRPMAFGPIWIGPLDPERSRIYLEM